MSNLGRNQIRSRFKSILGCFGFFAVLIVGPAFSDADHLFTVTEKAIYLQPQHVDGPHDAGTVLAATEITVLERRDTALRIRLSGWREQGVARAIYEQMGHRILAASLRGGAQRQVVVGDPVIDPRTDLVWHPASLEVWINPKHLTPDPSLLWDQGEAMFQTACAQCHSSMRPDDYLSNQWIGLMKSMERYITLAKPDYRFLQKYLQLHASDAGPQPGEDTTHAN